MSLCIRKDNERSQKSGGPLSGPVCRKPHRRTSTASLLCPGLADGGLTESAAGLGLLGCRLALRRFSRLSRRLAHGWCYREFPDRCVERDRECRITTDECAPRWRNGQSTWTNCSPPQLTERKSPRTGSGTSAVPCGSVGVANCQVP